MVGAMSKAVPASDQTVAPFGREDIPAAEKAARVRALFARVADKYDLMNDLMSGGVHRIWKDVLADRANPQPGEIILDCAGGTGDVARRIAKRVARVRARRHGEPARILVCDANEEMLRIGRASKSTASIEVALRTPKEMR